MHCHKIRKNRFPRSALKKIPTKKYQKSDKYDTCPICLNEYEEGVKIRLLPCEHVYHIECIDKWLLRNNRVCPVCKRRVIPGEPDSDEESNSNRPTSTSNVDIEQVANEDEETTESSRLLISRNDDNSLLNGSIHTLLNANSNELGSLNNQMTTSISSGQQLQAQSQPQLGLTAKHVKYGSISSINNIALASTTTVTAYVEPSSSYTNQHVKKMNTHKRGDDSNNDRDNGNALSDDERENAARRKKKRPSLDYYNEGIDSKATPDYFTPQSITSDSSAGFISNDTAELTQVDERNLLLERMSKKPKAKEHKTANGKKQRKLIKKNNKINSETSNAKQEKAQNDLNSKSKSKESKPSKTSEDESNINEHVTTDDRDCLINPSKSSSKKHQENKTKNMNEEDSESSATLSDSNV
jgi:hypothetical protein